MRHQVPIGLIGSDAAHWSTRNTISKHTYSTSKADRLIQDSDTPPKDEVDLEALVELEVEMHRQEGFPVPSEINPIQWQELLTKRSFSSRRKYLTFLFKNEMKRENQKKYKAMQREKREEEMRERLENPPPKSEHIEYGLWRNSIFMKVLDSTINHFYHTRVIQAMMFGQPLVVDVDFDQHMTSVEKQSCAYQIQVRDYE